jgi:tellurite methyltransferase
VPVPGCDVDDNAARLDGLMQNGGGIGEQQSENAAGEMESVHGGKNVDEGTAGATGEMKADGGKPAPNVELAGKKRQAENSGGGEPGEATFLAERDAGDGLDGSQGGFPGYRPARQIDGEAAANEDGGVDEQERPRKYYGDPSVDVGGVGGIEINEAAPDQIRHRERNKEHENGSHGDGQSQTGAAQTIAVVRHAIATAVVAVTPAGAGRQGSAVVAEGARRSRRQSRHGCDPFCSIGLESPGLELRIMPRSSWADDDRDARERWNQKYREAAGTDTWSVPDPFLLRVFSEYMLPQFPQGGSALDLAGGAGRHAIWLARQGWDVTLIDISETGVEQARQHAGPLASHIHFVVDDLTRFQASQTRYDVVMAFYYLEREVFAQMVKAVRPGGLLVYKTHTTAQANLEHGPKNPAHLLGPGELLQLTVGLEVLHYREEVAEKATAELVARKAI